ncbi:MAG: ribosomal-processing cysteine protease Prp [Mollicutes bacterium]|jgi:uncharacterized protein YsxB (DUF464 family)|nr:ribosomal-processing cysteine protease Prp [Mollicutes bacterium]
MIVVNIKKKDNLINEIIIKGHAKYDEYGKDIVCASISSIVITTINALLRIDQDSIKYQESDGLINIQVLKHSDVIDKLIINMIELLKDLQRQYRKNIKIND